MAAAPSSSNSAVVPNQLYLPRPPGFRPSQCSRSSTSLWNRSAQQEEASIPPKTVSVTGPGAGSSREAENRLCRQVAEFRFPEHPAIPYATRLPTITLETQYFYWFSWEMNRNVALHENLTQSEVTGTQRLHRPKRWPYKGIERYVVIDTLNLGFNIFLGEEVDRLLGRLALFVTEADLSDEVSDADGRTEASPVMSI